MNIYCVRVAIENGIVYRLQYKNSMNNRTLPPPSLPHKLSTILAILLTFQQKIQQLRIKLSTDPSFIPHLQYLQLDRQQKGYLTHQDIITYIKKSKPNFNIDTRYLQHLFDKLNQDSRVGKNRLTYFGYLNIVKPYFQGLLARDVVERDRGEGGSGRGVSVVCKRVFDDLLATMYVCVAEHERIKEVLILGDLQEGGTDPGTLLNVYQILQILKKEPQQPILSLQHLQLHPSESPHSLHLIPPSPDPHSKTHLQSHPQSHPQSQQYLSTKSIPTRKTNILDTLYNFIIRNSEYEIERQDMKYLLAYLVCHQYMVTQEKYLTQLFMPVCAFLDFGDTKGKTGVVQPERDNKDQNMNFLNYVHPNSVNEQQLKQISKNRPQPIPKHNQKPPKHPNLNKSPTQPIIQPRSQPLIPNQSRILNTSYQTDTLHTPILQRFMRQSKILKNMSRHRMDPINQQHEQQSSNNSAFVQESSKQYLDVGIGVEHKQKPVNKDFNLQDVLNNSKLERSQYYHNVSMRVHIKDAPLKPQEMSSRQLSGSGILNQFLFR